MTQREWQLLDLIKADPMISQQQLAELLGISRSAVASHIANLTAKGKIKGRGYVLTERQYCVAVGGANMDIVGIPGQAQIAASSTPGQVRHSPGGVARNIAENLARLGSECYLLAPIGCDHSGRQLRELSQAAGIHTEHLIELPGQSTSSYLSIVDEQGEMLYAIADMAILDALQPDHLRRQLTLLNSAELVVLDTNLKPSILAFLLEQLNGPALFVDTVSCAKASRITPLLHRIHTLKPNLAEAEAISGITLDSLEQLPTLAAWFHQHGVERLFISLGSRGLYASDKNGEAHHQQLPPEIVINSNGAGDALMAALCHAWQSGLSLEQTARFALAAANVALASEATINPDMSTLQVEAQLAR